MAPVATPEELLARISQRDEDALGDLYDRFAPRLYGVLARILHDRSSAEDVLLELYLRLWSDARTLSEAKWSVAAWLVVNARHFAVERLRAEKQARVGGAAQQRERVPPHKPQAGKSHQPKPVVPSVLPPSWIPLPEEVSRLDERLDLLRKVINQLPALQSKALELSVFEGYGEEEIAQELGEPLGKARAALRAAVTFLRHRRRAILGTWAAII